MPPDYRHGGIKTSSLLYHYFYRSIFQCIWSYCKGVCLKLNARCFALQLFLYILRQHWANSLRGEDCLSYSISLLSLNILKNDIISITYILQTFLFERTSLILLLGNIYILCVATEKPYSTPFARNVIYIPITTLSHATSMTSKFTFVLFNLMVPKLAEPMRVNVLLLQYNSLVCHFFVWILIETNINFKQ